MTKIFLVVYLIFQTPTGGLKIVRGDLLEGWASIEQPSVATCMEKARNVYRNYDGSIIARCEDSEGKVIKG